MIRAWLKLKRKSDKKVDENEDGARAVLIEEGIATWIFNDAHVLFFGKRPPRADGKPSTQALWTYDLRINCHFTLKKNPLATADLQHFVACYCTGAREQRQERERFKRFAMAVLLARDKLNLGIFWLKDESLGDMDSLPRPT